MNLPDAISVTEQTIDISWLSDAQKQYFIAVSEKLKNDYLARGKGRQVVCLSGPPGAGKSVITAILEHVYTNETEFIFKNVGLDAFHFPNAVLEERRLREVKGRYDTYNIEQLQAKLEAFTAGAAVSFPTYSRQLHEPVPDSIEVTGENVLLLLEGQWLLRNEPAWANLRTLCDYQLFVAGPIETMRENVIKRHIRGGRTEKDAARFYEESDRKNTLAVLHESVKPDEQLVFYKEI